MWKDKFWNAVAIRSILQLSKFDQVIKLQFNQTTIKSYSELFSLKLERQLQKIYIGN
jgi:hypothetical protein